MLGWSGALVASRRRLVSALPGLAVRIAVLPLLLALAVPATGRATVIDFLANVRTSASAACTNIPNYTCTTTAYFDAMSLDDQFDETIATNFVRSFDAWNATQAANAKWTLNFGGNPNGTFNIYVASAAVTDPNPSCNGFGPNGGTCGGLGIRIALRNIPAPVIGNNEVFGWSQGVFGNYENNGNRTVAPFYEMDVETGPCGLRANPICPPMYTFQDPTGRFRFADAPAFQFLPPGSTQAFFDADAYLSLANYTTRTLTVYDGVSYGYYNSIQKMPEPPLGIAVFGVLAPLLALLRSGAHRGTSLPPG